MDPAAGVNSAVRVDPGVRVDPPQYLQEGYKRCESFLLQNLNTTVKLLRPPLVPSFSDGIIQMTGHQDPRSAPACAFSS